MKKSIKVLNSCELQLIENWRVLSKVIYPNATCNAWRESLCQRLLDFSPETSKLWVIQMIAVGSGSSTPTTSDTKLETELDRQAIDTWTSVVNWTTVEVYANIPVWTTMNINEAWLFIDAGTTSTPDSWTLLCRSAFTNTIVKLDTQSLTIKWTISILNN